MPRKFIPIVSSSEPVLSDTSEEGGWGDLYQAHQKIYPRSVQGIFAKWRWGFVFLTQIIFYGLPWLEWGQRQAVLFDLGARRFYIFGIVLYPQDFIYLTGLLVISAFSLFLFTAIAGRLWCGFACPQTVYSEIFLWIERKVEGDRTARMRLACFFYLDRVYVCWLFHAYSGTGHGFLLGRHVVLGSVLGFVLWLCNLRQRRFHARTGLQVHVSLCALSKRHV
jgi:polyferredoxin